MKQYDDQIKELKKDIDELKNKKITEMEEILEIKSKKETARAELESLKTDIIKHRTFLASLKKINVGDSIPSGEGILSPEGRPREQQPGSRTPESSKVQIIPRRPPVFQGPSGAGVHLPDLINHENGPEKSSAVLIGSNKNMPVLQPQLYQHLRHRQMAQTAASVAETSVALSSVSPVNFVTHSSAHIRNDPRMTNNVMNPHQQMYQQHLPTWTQPPHQPPIQHTQFNSNIHQFLSNDLRRTSPQVEKHLY